MLLRESDIMIDNIFRVRCYKNDYGLVISDMVILDKILSLPFMLSGKNHITQILKIKINLLKIKIILKISKYIKLVIFGSASFYATRVIVLPCIIFGSASFYATRVIVLPCILCRNTPTLNKFAIAVVMFCSVNFFFTKV